MPLPVAGGDDCEEAKKWFNEGSALSDHSQREASYYRKAIELCPDHFQAHNELGEVYMAWGDFELAIKEFQVASRNTLFVDPHHNMGKIYKMQGRYDLAAEAFVKAIRIKPDFREAQNLLKYVNKRLGKYDFIIDNPPDPIPISIFTRIPGMTLPKGTFLLDLQYKYWRQEADLKADMFVEAPPPLFSPPSKRRISVHAWILGIRYGLTDNLTLGLMPKFFSRTADVEIPFWKIKASPSITGIGDTVFMTKYRLWGKGRTHLSAYHLLSIPTGDEEAEAQDKDVVRRIPLGSGSFDFTPGIAFTTVKDPFTLHGGLSYVITDGRQAGDEFNCDLAVVFPRLYDFMGMLELNYRWRDSARRRQLVQSRFGFQPGPGPDLPPGPWTEETTIEEPGGHSLFLSPGVVVSLTKGLKAEVGFQIPLFRGGDGWTEDFVIHLGLRKYF
ncbi:MAG: tetratricopeptide repeat protein, partial [Thermodesulfobacteriota bacterium]|nr:tetratricopeptide repeat protein [Thermodesulfobacteriota bacterium]